MTGFDIIYATLDEAFDREAGLHSMVVALGRAGALRVSWGLHVGAMTALAWAAWLLVTATGAVRPLWAGVTIACWAAGAALLWLEQRWAEDVNLAFFKTNVVVGFLVLATVLAARMASGGF